MARIKTIKEDQDTVSVEVNHLDIIVQDSLGRMQIMSYTNRETLLFFIWNASEKFLGDTAAKVVIGDMPNIKLTVLACSLPEYKVTYSYLTKVPTIN